MCYLLGLGYIKLYISRCQCVTYLNRVWRLRTCVLLFSQANNKSHSYILGVGTSVILSVRFGFGSFG